MKIYKIYLAFCAIIFVFQLFFLVSIFDKKPESNFLPQQQQQRPPLSVFPDEECHIADAVPLLSKKNYKSGVYKISQSSKKPLVIFETFKADNATTLKIEQRGCEDIYAKFDFTFGAKRDRGIGFNLRKAAQTLKNLKINPDALINSKTVSRIADTALSESKRSRPSKNKVICLSKIQSECVTDVSVAYKYPHLRLFYIDRP